VDPIPVDVSGDVAQPFKKQRLQRNRPTTEPLSPTPTPLTEGDAGAAHEAKVQLAQANFKAKALAKQAQLKGAKHSSAKAGSIAGQQQASSSLEAKLELSFRTMDAEVALFLKAFAGQLKEMPATPAAKIEVDVDAFISEMETFLKQQFAVAV
jgi:hypothetical protein